MSNFLVLFIIMMISNHRIIISNYMTAWNIDLVLFQPTLRFRWDPQHLPVPWAS
jgi:hypothetical protein